MNNKVNRARETSTVKRVEKNMLTMCWDGQLSLLELFLTNCDQCTHTSTEIGTILSEGSNVQAFVSIEETVLRGFFHSLDPKFLQQAALNHCWRCSLEHRDLHSERMFTGAKMVCYRRICLVLHCAGVDLIAVLETTPLAACPMVVDGSSTCKPDRSGCCYHRCGACT